MKFYILKKPCWSFSLFTAKLSPYKIQLETGYLIKNFVNDWYFNHKYAGSVKT